MFVTERESKISVFSFRFLISRVLRVECHSIYLYDILYDLYSVHKFLYMRIILSNTCSMIKLLKLLKPYHSRFVEIHLYSRDGGDLWSDRWEEGQYCTMNTLILCVRKKINYSKTFWFVLSSTLFYHAKSENFFY